jgi:hypothetical protein
VSIRRLALVPAVILVLVGAVWILQGMGLLKGSVMTGERQWEAIGFVVLVVGLLVGWFALRRRRRQA